METSRKEEMQREIDECQRDIDKMLKEMKDYEKIFADAAIYFRKLAEKDPVIPGDEKI